MANKALFNKVNRSNLTVNDAGGRAYSLKDKEALAQLVMTGTFNGTFYTEADKKVEQILELLSKLDPKDAQFVAKLAIYARQRGFMKDTPAFLTAWISKNAPELFRDVFNQVIDNGKMLRNFVQIMRSGAVGRRSLGTAPKKMVQKWLTTASVNAILATSVGNDPSLADVIKMVHPRPVDEHQEVLFKWIVAGEVSDSEFTQLPSSVQDLIRFRRGEIDHIPAVPFELLTSQPLTTHHWKQIAELGGWHMIRQNLNTFARNGVFDDKSVVRMLAARLKDPEVISRAKVMPYQLFTTYLNMDPSTPIEIKKALEAALEFSLHNVPVYDGKTLVFVDVSGSMGSPITGHRKGSSSKTRCVDVASLIACSFLKVNPQNTKVVMFDTEVHRASLDPNASVMGNAKIISEFGGGGTCLELPLQEAVSKREKADLIIYISDNESWLTHSNYGWGFGYGNDHRTATKGAFDEFRAINPGAKMVCIDICANTTTQAESTPFCLNVGGFNDSVYRVISGFIASEGVVDYWTQLIEVLVDI
jgi:60 kDa SS-A/Ro ribonucleoprotein